MQAFLLRPADRSDRRHQAFLADAPAATALNAWIRSTRPDVPYETREVDEIWLDGGGSARVGEAKASFKARGVRFACFVRQVPFLAAAFRGLREEKKLPGHVVLPGFVHVYVLSLATRDALVAGLRAFERLHASEIRDGERAAAEAFSGHPNVVYAAPCSCMSGKSYTECHGRRA